MAIKPWLNSALLIAAKLAVLWLMALITLFGLAVFIAISVTAVKFEIPFLQAAAITLGISILVSLVCHTWRPMVAVAIVLGYSMIFFEFPRQAYLLPGVICVAGAINFLYRNKFTEPLLILLPILAATWVFVLWIYPFYLYTWFYWKTGEYVGSTDALSVLTFSGMWWVVTPWMAMYVLGKHHYIKIYQLASSKLLKVIALAKAD